MRHKVFRLIAIGVVACSDGPTSPPVAVAAVKISPDSTAIAVRTTAAYTATTIGPAGVELKGRPVVWSVSDNAIAKIDAASGVVTAVAPGQVSVTATSEGVAGIARLVVFSGPPATLVSIGGGGPARCFAAAPSSLKVRVVDADGFAVAGVTVVFSVTSGGGSLSTSEKITTRSIVSAADGSAETPWVYGVGEQRASAHVNGLADVAFSGAGNAVAGESALDLRTSASLTASNRRVVAPPIVIRAHDSCDQPISVAISASVASGGVLSGSTSVQTDASGLATFSDLVISGTVGQKSVTFGAPGIPSVTVGVSLTSGQAAQVAIVAGNNQAAPPGSAVATPPTVVVTDADGNPVAGTSVTFAVASGGGSIAGPTAVTNAAGIAQPASWTLGSLAGTNTLTATATGVAGIVTFTVTAALANGAASVTKVAGDGQTGPQGDALPTAPSVLVRDNQGTPVAGVTVGFSAQNGSVANSTVTTNSSGIAQPGEWRLGGAVGSASLTATVSGLPPVVFGATVASSCTWTYALQAGTARSGDFQQFDCAGPSGEFRDRYSVTISAGMYTVRVQSSTNSAVELYTGAGTLIARNEDESAGSNNARLRAILPAGSYQLLAQTVAAGQTGSYSIDVSASDPNVTACELVYVAAASATTQLLNSNDCVVTLQEGNYFEDRFLRRLNAGEQMTVTMSSSALDSYLIIADASGNEITFNDDKASGTLDAEVTFTAPVAGLYMIRASSSQVAQQGSYSLTVR